jgi:hypothetical protein
MFPSCQQKKVSELCSRVVAANDPIEFAQAVSELRAALRAQLTHLRELVYEAKQTIAQLPPAPFNERRKKARRKMDRRQEEGRRQLPRLICSYLWRMAEKSPNPPRLDSRLRTREKGSRRNLSLRS